MTYDCPHCSLSVTQAESSAPGARCSSCGGSLSFDLGAADPSAPAAGGRFELIERVGAGSFGAVWKARDRVLGRLVALKILHAGAVDSSQVLERFQREARTVSQLRHPGIVSVHEVLELSGRPVMVSDLVHGTTIDRYREGRPLPPREAARLVRQAAEALEYAHSMGVVHRDIKPANLMVESIEGAEEPRLVVLDFGLALTENLGATLTTDGQLLGTPAYMSPEQALGSHHGVDRRSDVYSLGAVLYELLTGVLPFRGGSASILQQLIHTEPKPPRFENPHVPRDLESICRKAMAKSSRDRYGSARELAEDLGRFLDDLPVLARPLSRWERSSRWVQRNPVTATLGAAILLLLSVVTVVSIVSAVRLQHERDAALENLYAADLAEARARIASPLPGRHFDSMRALDRARARHASQDVRNATIAALSRIDLEVGRTWHMRPPGDWQNIGLGFDEALSVCWFAHGESLLVIALPESTVVARRSSIGGNVLVSPDGRFALTYGGRGDPFALHDLRESRPLVVGRSCVWGARGAFSPDNSRAVFCLEDGTFVVYELPSGRELRRVPTGMLPDAFVSDRRARRVAYRESNDTQPIRIADLETGAVSVVSPGVPEAPLAWAPDGNRMVVWREGSIEVLDLRDGTRVVLDGLRRTQGCRWNPTSDLIASHDWDGLTRLFDPASGKQLLCIPGHAAHWSEDGSRLAFGSGSEEVGWWNVAQSRECRVRRDPGTRTWMKNGAISPDGRLLVAASQECVNLWDIELGEVIARVQDAPADVAFDETGRTLLTRDERGLFARTLEYDGEAQRIAVGAPEILVRPEVLGQRFVTQFSPNGRWAVMPHGRLRALRVDLVTGDTLSVGPHVAISSVTVSPDGNWIATAAGLGEGIKIWDARTRALHREIAAGTHGRVGFSSDGRWLYTCSFGTPTCIWEMPTFELHRKLGEKEIVYFLGTGDELLSLVGTDRLRLTETDTGRELAVLYSQAERPLPQVVPGPSGDWIVTLRNGEAILDIWDLRLLRARLAERGLDWEAPPYPPRTTPVLPTIGG